MGKFDRFEAQQQQKSAKPWKIHPVWRGIGCLMLIVIPIMAYAAADVFYADAPGMTFLDMPVLPSSGEIYTILFSLRLTDGIVLRISIFHIVATLLFSVIAFLIFSFVYSLIYRLTGPPKYGPTDAPPTRYKKRRR